MTSADVPTRLRQIADARAIDVALAACLIGLVPAFLVAGGVWAAAVAAVLPVVLLTLAAILVATLGVVLLHRARTRLPGERTRIVRGPGSARQGVVAFVTLFGVLLIPFAVAAIEMSGENPRGVPLLIGVVAVLALLLADVFIVPAVVLGRARASFRAAAERDRNFRALLDQDRLTWHPSYGDMAYGPL